MLQAVFDARENSPALEKRWQKVLKDYDPAYGSTLDHYYAEEILADIGSRQFNLLDKAFLHLRQWIKGIIKKYWNPDSSNDRENLALDLYQLSDQLKRSVAVKRRLFPLNQVNPLHCAPGTYF